MLKSQTVKVWQAASLPPPRQNIWQWAEANVDFSLAPSYDTPLKARYDADFMPFWKEVSEALTNPAIREVTVCKCARAGGSENLLLNTIRYTVAVNPQPTLYVTGDQLSAERMMEKRIKRGFRCAPDCWRLFKRAQHTQHDIAFPGMDLRVTWPKAKQAFKQDGWALVLCDEVSTWPEFSADMARKRTDSYAFGHICFISSPDPQQKRSSDEDPIFIEFKAGDQRYWMMPDPATGNLFKFEMGGKDTAHGLKWDASAKRDDGSYDLERVKQSAHYVTPDGTIIRNEQKRDLIARGKWMSTAAGAPGYRRSYHINAFYMPFRSGDFGEIAAAFLTANARGPQHLRTFVYEYLAEPWYGEKLTIESQSIEQRRGGYKMGQRAAIVPAYSYLAQKRSKVLMTIDVQKSKFYCLVREWFDGGDSMLVDWQEIEDWKDVAAMAAKHSAARIFIDLGYEERRNEVLEQCIFGYIKGAIPTFGRDSLKGQPKIEKRDPFEGTGKGGKAKLAMITFNPNQVKYILSNLTDANDTHQWIIPSDIDAEYIRQMTSEECIDGQWIKKNKDNHLWDCEVMQLMAGMILGIFRQVAIDLEMPEIVTQQTAPVSTRKRGVYMPY